jgi:hypothetical protein
MGSCRKKCCQLPACPFTVSPRSANNPAVLGETQNQFSLMRGAFSAGGLAKKDFLSVHVAGVELDMGKRVWHVRSLGCAAQFHRRGRPLETAPGWPILISCRTPRRHA